MTKVLRLLPAALFLVIASIALSQDGDAFQPGRFYKDMCSSCHVIPDPAQPADRAWADQVLRTN